MFPALLRLLLCLCLLLDTVAPAVAATHMAMAMPGAGHDASAPADDDADHGAMADCHTLRDAAPTREAPPAQDDEDCLQRCLDLCLQHGFAVLSPAKALRAQVPALHAFPPLRPPIA